MSLASRDHQSFGHRAHRRFKRLEATAARVFTLCSERVALELNGPSNRNVRRVSRDWSSVVRHIRYSGGVRHAIHHRSRALIEAQPRHRIGRAIFFAARSRRARAERRRRQRAEAELRARVGMDEQKVGRPRVRHVGQPALARDERSPLDSTRRARAASSMCRSIKKSKAPLFDHAKMAATLTSITREPYDSQHLRSRP